MTDAVRRLHLPPEVIIGLGTLAEVGRIVERLASRVMLVSHAAGRFTATGIPDRAEQIMRTSGVSVTRTAILPEPSTEAIDEAAALARRDKIEAVVGLGGGSPLDAAKAIAALATHNGTCADYQMGARSFSRKALPTVCIPTTAGTGSEVSRVSVLLNRPLRVRKSLNDPRLIPAVAILDAELTVGLSKQQTGAVGLDAMSHAIESNASRGATALTDALSLKAMSLLAGSLGDAIQSPNDLRARGDALVGSSLAGMALNAGVGAAHILAQPISSVTDLSHSTVISILLPHVIQANAGYAAECYQRLAEAATGRPVAADDGANVLVDLVTRLRHAAELPTTFSELGVTRGQLNDALETATKWQAHITTNPRPVSRELLDELLQTAY